MAREWLRNDGYVISTDAARLDVDAMHRHLLGTYWAAGRSREAMERAIANALPFGLYAPHGAQVGFARVVTDYAVFAYLGDVFVVPEHRWKGLATWLVATILAHPDLQHLRRWHLVTRDAHGLYRKAGFRGLADPDQHMERVGR